MGKRANFSMETFVNTTGKRRIGFFLRIGVYLGCVVAGCVVIAFLVMMQKNLAESCGNADKPYPSSTKTSCICEDNKNTAPKDCDEKFMITLSFLGGKYPWYKDGNSIKYGDGCPLSFGTGTGSASYCGFVLYTAILWMVTTLGLMVLNIRSICKEDRQPTKNIIVEFYICSFFAIWVFVCAIVVTVGVETTATKMCNVYGDEDYYQGGLFDKYKDACAVEAFKLLLVDQEMQYYNGADIKSASDFKKQEQIGWNGMDAIKDACWATFVLLLAAMFLTYNRYQQAKMLNVYNVADGGGGATSPATSTSIQKGRSGPFDETFDDPSDFQESANEGKSEKSKKKKKKKKTATEEAASSGDPFSEEAPFPASATANAPIQEPESAPAPAPPSSSGGGYDDEDPFAAARAESNEDNPFA